MKKTLLSAIAIMPLLFASCEKESFVRRNAPAMKVNVTGVLPTKASVVTTDILKSQAQFLMSCYVTQPWQRDSIGTSVRYDAGIYVDPGTYSGPYDETGYPTPDGNKFKDIPVNYLSNGKWMIEGNYDSSGNYLSAPRFSWINDVTMRFFAYAPVTVNGNRSISKSDTSCDKDYPFSFIISGAATGNVTSTNCDDLIFASSDHKATYGSVSGSSTFGQLLNGTTDIFDLTFYHALSQIRFCLSTNDDTYDSSLKLVSIKILGPQSSAAGVTPVTFAGLPGSGSCVFTQPSQTVLQPFVWSSPGSLAFYSQTFNADFSSSTPTNWVAGTYSPSTGVTKNLYTCTGDVLFLIPQTISGCNIEVTFQQGTDPAFSMVGKLPDGEWVAGKYYTYKIKASKGLDITLLTSDWYDASSPVNF